MSQENPMTGKPQLVKIGDNVYTAVNMGGGNTSMIIGEKGIVLIDTSGSIKSGEDILNEFRKITDKPVKAIFYTHGHADHTSGASAFVADGKNADKSVQVWARDNLFVENRLFADLMPAFIVRGAKQFGMTADQAKFAFAPSTTHLEPTHFLNANTVQKVQIDEIELELHATSGETADHMYIWYPEKGVLFTGDMMYRSFPNMYAVRGAGYRDAKSWVNAIAEMKEIQPTYLVFGHSLPTLSREESEDYLKNYHEALAYVYEKSCEGINKGLTLDELGEYAQLPEHLRTLPYLGEHYGNVSWTAKGIYIGHFGWFDGNARKLAPLNVIEEAKKMAELAGGEDVLLAKAQKALEEKEYKWAAQLADYCLLLNLKAEIIKAEALEALAEEQTSSTGKNFCLSDARILREA